MRNVLTIVAAALGVATASSAFGQTQDPDALVPVNVSVRLGVGLPIDDNLRDFGSTFLGLGLEYRIDRSLLRTGETYFSLDGFKSDKSDEGYVIPFTLNQRVYLRQITDGRRTYAFAGLGVAFIKGDGWDAGVAARGGIGSELGERLFLEGSLTITDRVKGVNGNLIGIYLGYRF